MSALPQHSDIATRSEPPARPTLRAVSRRAQPIAQLPFVLVVAVLLGGGMAGVLLLSTTIQSQSAELSRLQATESELGYQEAALVATVQDLRSSQNLAERAWELGMRPNPNPAFIQMPGGEVVGVPTPVTGDELSGMVPPAPAPAPAAPPAQAEAGAAEPTPAATPGPEPVPAEQEAR